MDKKDYNENEHLENNGTTEENITSDTETTVPAAAEIKESVPVMSKVGSAPIAPPAAPKSNKAWMIASLILAAALIVVLIKPPFQKADGEAAVATVNGANITKDQLYAKLVEAGGENTLKSMITTTLVEQEAKKANVPAITDADINTEIEDLKTQFGGEAALNAALSQSGMTLEDLKKQMPIQVQLRKILEPQVKITEDDMKKYYEENKATYDTEEQVRASHILVKTEAEAQEILKQLKGGADFAALAKEKSADTGSKDNGGDLDFFKKADMDPSFAEAAFKLKVGETSGAVKSQYGYHIIKVTDRKEAHTSTYEEKKDEVKKTLVSQKVSEMSTKWLEDTTAKAKITNTLTKEDAATDAPATGDAPAATEAPAK